MFHLEKDLICPSTIGCSRSSSMVSIISTLPALPGPACFSTTTIIYDLTVPAVGPGDKITSIKKGMILISIPKSYSLSPQVAPGRSNSSIYSVIVSNSIIGQHKSEAQHQVGVLIAVETIDLYHGTSSSKTACGFKASVTSGFTTNHSYQCWLATLVALILKIVGTFNLWY